jgi:hypothetical protein
MSCDVTHKLDIIEDWAEARGRFLSSQFSVLMFFANQFIHFIHDNILF